jgi:nucleotidyltransferase substrate binding protein (TIGR01987 family)
MTALPARLEGLAKALGRLKEALAVPPEQPLALDGTIQRFEFAYELFWKTLKAALYEEGLQVETPREALKAAFAAGWLGDEVTALRMMQARNLTSHTYDEETARSIYEQIPEFLHLMEEALKVLKAKGTA